MPKIFLFQISVIRDLKILNLNMFIPREFDRPAVVLNLQARTFSRLIKNDNLYLVCIKSEKWSFHYVGLLFQLVD